jgi:hypothetical protein
LMVSGKLGAIQSDGLKRLQMIFAKQELQLQSPFP